MISPLALDTRRFRHFIKLDETESITHTHTPRSSNQSMFSSVWLLKLKLVREKKKGKKLKRYCLMKFKFRKVKKTERVDASRKRF